MAPLFFGKVNITDGLQTMLDTTTTQPLFMAPLSPQMLIDMVALTGWPNGATCATQEIDGEILFWKGDVETIVEARKKATPSAGLINVVDINRLVSAVHPNKDVPECAIDWMTAVVEY